MLNTITKEEFIQKYIGKYVDIDGAYGNQCKDLFSAYNTQVVGNPNYVPGDAWQLFDNAPSEYYDKIKATDGTPMRVGDVPIWKQSFGGRGHVGVATEIGSYTFKALSQNYPKVTKLDAKGKVLENGSPCNISEFSYGNLYGWLRPKKFATIEDMKTLHDFTVDGMPADERIEALKNQVRQKNDIINSPTDGIAAKQRQIEERDRILDQKRARIEELEKENEELKKNQNGGNDESDAQKKLDTVKQAWKTIGDTLQ